MNDSALFFNSIVSDRGSRIHLTLQRPKCPVPQIKPSFLPVKFFSRDNDATQFQPTLRIHSKNPMTVLKGAIIFAQSSESAFSGIATLQNQPVTIQRNLRP